jgi:hypothetical protein
MYEVKHMACTYRLGIPDHSKHWYGTWTGTLSCSCFIPFPNLLLASRTRVVGCFYPVAGN